MCGYVQTGMSIRRIIVNLGPIPGNARRLASDLMTRSFIMIQVKKASIIAVVISTVFLLAAGTSAMAEYSQTQNKIDDKDVSSKQSQPDMDSKKKNNKDKSDESAKSSDKKTDGNTKKSAEADKKTPSGTERKGNY